MANIQKDAQMVNRKQSQITSAGLPVKTFHSVEEVRVERFVEKTSNSLKVGLDIPSNICDTGYFRVVVWRISTFEF